MLIAGTAITTGGITTRAKRSNGVRSGVQLMPLRASAGNSRPQWLKESMISRVISLSDEQTRVAFEKS